MEEKSVFEKSWKGICGDCIACQVINGIRQGGCMAMNDNSFGRTECDDFMSAENTVSGIVQAMIASIRKGREQQDEEQDV